MLQRMSVNLITINFVVWQYSESRPGPRKNLCNIEFRTRDEEIVLNTRDHCKICHILMAIIKLSTNEWIIFQ